jgi:hypothetical protein
MPEKKFKILRKWEPRLKEKLNKAVKLLAKD